MSAEELAALCRADPAEELASLPPALQRLRAAARLVRDPTAGDAVLAVLLRLARELSVQRVLEIGTGEGLTSLALALSCPAVQITTIEAEEERYLAARRNFAAFGAEGRIKAVFADAAEVLPVLREGYDLLFLDGPKAQYVHWLPQLKRLLRPGGVLAADDVLLYGWVDGSVPCPPKRRSIAQRLREYLSAVQADDALETLVLPLGEGLALSRKRRAV